MTSAEILSSLRWSKARLVQTKKGPRFVRSATATPDVLELWDTERRKLYDAGYSVGEYNGEMQISEWRENEESRPAAPDVERTVESRLDRLTKTNMRALSKKYAHTGPMTGFLFGRPVEEVQRIVAQMDARRARA